MSKILTFRELNTLPEKSVVLDIDEDAWQLTDEGWESPAQVNDMEAYGPFRVIYNSDDAGGDTNE